MSDRSKKIIWIAVAVSGFALVVFLTAFILFPPNEMSQSKPFDLTGRSPAKPLSPNDFSAFPSIVVQSSGDSSQVPDNTQADSANASKSTGPVVVVPAPSANQKTENAKTQTSIAESNKSSAASKTSRHLRNHQKIILSTGACSFFLSKDDHSQAALKPICKSKCSQKLLESSVPTQDFSPNFRILDSGRKFFSKRNGG
jgi:hypothetical protein